jgi:hypothetical protein
MSRRDLYRDPDYDRLRREQEEWDHEHFERSMDNIRDLQREPGRGYDDVGAGYEGGVFSSATYGSGAEFYSVTGMYDNPLLPEDRNSHRGKGPRSYKRTDERLHDEICERLTRHPLIDASLMEVTVEGGEVTLNGEVLDRRMKHMAEDVVDEVSGVREIHNHLRVTHDRVA